MAGALRYVVDFGCFEEGLLMVGVPIKHCPDDGCSHQRVLSYKTRAAAEEGVKRVLAESAGHVAEPAAVVYDKEEGKYLLYRASGFEREVPWDWGKWPPHIKLDPN